MKLDQAIQKTIFETSDREIEDIAWLAENNREEIILDYHCAYGWTFAECEEFLDNVTLAHELLVKDPA